MSTANKLPLLQLKLVCRQAKRLSIEIHFIAVIFQPISMINANDNEKRSSGNSHFKFFLIARFWKILLKSRASSIFHKWTVQFYLYWLFFRFNYQLVLNKWVVAQLKERANSLL